jgi:hypothetical protein
MQNAAVETLVYMDVVFLHASVGLNTSICTVLSIEILTISIDRLGDDHLTNR